MKSSAKNYYYIDNKAQIDDTILIGRKKAILLECILFQVNYVKIIIISDAANYFIEIIVLMMHFDEKVRKNLTNTCILLIL